MIPLKTFCAKTVLDRSANKFCLAMLRNSSSFPFNSKSLFLYRCRLPLQWHWSAALSTGNSRHHLTFSRHSAYFTSRVLSRHSHSKNGIDAAVAGRLSNRCSCCGLNTRGDQELSEFLTNELKFEKSYLELHQSLPVPAGFVLRNADGPTVILEKHLGHEKICVKLNMTEAVLNVTFDDVILDSDDEYYPQKCLPPFVVEIIKEGKENTLTVHCVCLSPDEMPPLAYNDESEFPLMEIQDVCISKITERQTAFCMSSLSEPIHDRLLPLLVERGVDRHFTELLTELATIIEHQRYVNFLNELNDFVRCPPQLEHGI